MTSSQSDRFGRQPWCRREPGTSATWLTRVPPLLEAAIYADCRRSSRTVVGVRMSTAQGVRLGVGRPPMGTKRGRSFEGTGSYGAGVARQLTPGNEQLSSRRDALERWPPTRRWNSACVLAWRCHPTRLGRNVRPRTGRCRLAPVSLQATVATPLPLSRCDRVRWTVPWRQIRSSAPVHDRRSTRRRHLVRHRTRHGGDSA